jgi:hypothetical protein
MTAVVNRDRSVERREAVARRLEIYGMRSSSRATATPAQQRAAATGFCRDDCEPVRCDRRSLGLRNADIPVHRKQKLGFRLNLDGKY